MTVKGLLKDRDTDRKRHFIYINKSTKLMFNSNLTKNMKETMSIRSQNQTVGIMDYFTYLGTVADYFLQVIFKIYFL